MLVYMVRIDEQDRPSRAIVDNEEHARELEQLGYQRVYQEVEEHDRGSNGRGSGSR